MEIGIKQHDVVTVLTKIKIAKDQNSKMFFKRENIMASQTKLVENFKNDTKTIAKDSILIEKHQENIESNENPLKVKTSFKELPAETSKTFHLKQKNPLKEQSHSAPNQNENRIRTVFIKEKIIRPEKSHDFKIDDLKLRQTTTIITTPRESESHLPKIISPLYERFLSSILRMSGKKRRKCLK
jgi:hypothetical protein